MFRPGLLLPGHSESRLCATCVFASVIENARGSRFTLCRRSEADAHFPRYPALPVLECIGYEKASADNTPAVDESIPLIRSNAGLREVNHVRRLRVCSS